ncbi:MAG: CinA family protein [Propionibacterium sp.]|nr:CinA family protein [Propionibacterium sp.]
MTERAAQVIKQFTNRSITLATCESITGGGIGAALTTVPGASAVFRGGLITYARDLKASLAKVDPRSIAEDGVVNEITAYQMARGARIVCHADWAVATTGVAGPTETDGATVGTVWFAVVGPAMGMSNPPVYTELRHFDGDRESIREQSVDFALAMLLRVSGGGE